MRSFTDKLPEWIVKFRQEGLTDVEINEIIKGKEFKYINKWGNSSKVGILINNYNNDKKMQDTLKLEARMNAPRIRTEQQSPKAARAALSSLPALEMRGSAAQNRTRSINQRGSIRNTQKPSPLANTIDYGHFCTTNRAYHDKIDAQDFSTVKNNFKKKTPFT